MKNDFQLLIYNVPNDDSSINEIIKKESIGGQKLRKNV